ncbi:ABC transporter substrate-binding protein [Pseudomonas vancouverensis]|uniref:ABC transporter substrate-binding protein n=1 Tax=Pseudomonas vancouverensis TaxID=95300 RepID=UPI003CFCEFA4
MAMVKLIGLFALVCISASAFSEESKVVRIGIEPSYPPFSYKTSDGGTAGFDYDMGNALCAEMKVKCVWVEQEFDGLIPSLKVRKIDAILSSMLITSERLKSVDFTQQYYRSMPARLAMKQGSVINDPLVDLKGKKVGVQQGTTNDRFASDVLVPAGVEVVRYGSQGQLFLDLVAGRLDAGLADIVNIYEGFLNTDAGKGYTVVGPDFDDPKYFGDGNGIAVRKGDKAMQEQFNSAIAAVNANGTCKRLQEKYFKFEVCAR